MPLWTAGIACSPGRAKGRPGQGFLRVSSKTRKAVPATHDAGRELFDARQLHAWLGNKDMFANWWRDRIKQYGFEKGVDFFGVFQKNPPARTERPAADRLSLHP
ncbi:MAG: antA/AntB antirepressor family protein [Alphaproteobacteria bacterium]|nr:antA/AntB antirepressor family protein [Alphaproteobacteria bacterium]